MPSQAIHRKRREKWVCVSVLGEETKKIMLRHIQYCRKAFDKQLVATRIIQQMISHLSPHTHTHTQLLKNKGNICDCVMLHLMIFNAMLWCSHRWRMNKNKKKENKNSERSFISYSNQDWKRSIIYANHKLDSLSDL